MFNKTLVAAALVIPAVGLSAAAFAGSADQGGPRSTMSASAPNQTFQTNKSYAQYVPRAGVRAKHIYQGGPKSTILHRQE